MSRVNYSGKTMKISDKSMKLPNGQSIAGKTFRVEGYWDELTGKSWMKDSGTIASILYGMRNEMQGLPLDNEVLYGKVEWFGVLVHVSELEEIE